MKAFVTIALFLFSSVILINCNNPEPSPVGRFVIDGIITTIAGVPSSNVYTPDGSVATKTSVGYVTAVSVDAAGNIFYCDGAANTIRKIDAMTQVVTTVGGYFKGYNVPDQTPAAGDGGMATQAHLNLPIGLMVANSGNIYIADAANSRIRKIEFSTDLMRTVAGGFFSPSSPTNYGDGGQAINAILWNPEDVAVDSEENLFIADLQNNSIRKVTSSTGVITTIAGQGPAGQGFGGDGAAAISAKLNSPASVAIDTKGNLIIADRDNHVIRMINSSSGVITTVAGKGNTKGYSGDGELATACTLSYPSGVTVDKSGNIFIADKGNNVIREIIATTGKIVTVAGTGEAGYSGDGGSSSNAALSSPVRVAVDSNGVLYIADQQNGVIRAVKF